MQADLSQYRWHNRLLVTFAPTAEVAARQARLFAADAMGRRDRSLLRLVVLPDAVTIEGRPSRLDAAALRRKYRVAPDGFRTLLVGKDGTVAASFRKPTALTAVYARIDAMPMRRDEVRRKGG